MTTTQRDGVLDSLVNDGLLEAYSIQDDDGIDVMTLHFPKNRSVKIRAEFGGPCESQMGSWFDCEESNPDERYDTEATDAT